ncbi:hypothetical protein C1H46_008662 [Malus baccata]|uniref:Oligopeptide transporter 4 n=1 Tax=Malus baccata TaxID=106549 RepID=A0A540N3X1_MALBA|nr:hypothetical protein C1H46_008662 [Malus baccata]
MLAISTDITANFMALHEKDEKRMSRAKFFLITLVCSFTWYAFPGYLFTTLTNISWVCWLFSKSVTAQQIGSGMRGLGVGSLTLDWSAVASFLFSPLICPFFVIVNVFAGYALILYLVIPIAYWGLDSYSAQKFPIFSSHLFTAEGQDYNITAIVNDKFQLDIPKYEEQGRIHLSMFFALTYGFGFATIASTLTHVALFYGREILDRYRSSYKGKEDIHTRLMRRYKDIPSWWFYMLLIITVAVSLVLCIVLNDEVQMPWCGLLFAGAMAFTFTLPISIITATTNQTPGLNIITEYVMGIISLVGPVIVWVLHKAYPKQHWIRLINLPVLLGATGLMPPATALNYNSWIIVGNIFNFFVFHYRKNWWQRYNYILSAAMDAGVAFMAVLLYLSVGMENKSLTWWGTNGEHCDVATCPTAKGIAVDGCPVN